MVFHTYHNCNMYCKRLVAYIRIDNRWTKVGYFGTGCKQFEPLDLDKENKERADIIKNQLVNPKLFCPTGDMSS